MSDTTGRDVIGGIDLSSDRYVIKQSYIRSKYAVEDANGNVVLKGRKKRFKLKEEFPFTDSGGNVVFRIKARNLLDVSGSYALEDEATGETFAVIEKEFTMFKHVYNVRSPDGALWARIESESALVMALKGVSELFGLLPHSYSVTGPNGESIGSIEERFSLRDVYDVRIGDAGDAPREAIIAAAVAIDALEEN
ncbi:LURP-one-related/scramblase family protein [Halomarina pelagica]|uniref:LURP-one-related/scramblase family protein n=1 Tax=Halomarina pelagica TaxID=2961599 RepID=UPI0020C43BB2|nr:hypothetical protein [Halomarina sp. BND7]